jgi:hypothetical protein
MLIVTPLLATLCGFAFWFYQVHAAEMSVYRKVREPVWATATFGCGNAGETAANLPGPRGATDIASSGPPLIPADFSPVFRNVPVGPHNDAITRSVEQGVGQTSETLDGKSIPQILTTPNTTFRTTARMTCNENVETGQPDRMKRVAAVAFQP